jgi:two-component system, OmpR family, sensor kinase
MACVISLTLAVSALITALAVRDYLTDRLSSQLVAAATRIAPSLRALNGVTMEYRQLAGVLERQATITVVSSAGRVIAWSHTDETTAADLVAAPVSIDDPGPVVDHPDLIAIKVDTAGMGLAARESGTLLPIDGLVIALDSTEDSASVWRIVTTNVVATAVAIVALIVLTNVIVGRGLQPLRAISRRAVALAAGASAERLPVPDNDPDIGRLAGTVNAAFDAQQQADRRLRDFVADASHELRTPLTTASGWVELYLQGGLPDPAKRDRAMSRVEAELGRMRLLVDDLALLARLDHGRRPDLTTVDLAALARDVVADSRVADPLRPITFAADGPAPVSGDSERLVQVSRNLIGNALQHTPPETAVRVGIRPASSSGPPAWVVLVDDDGPGIPAGDQPHVFDRFWRGDQSRSRNTGGSGLGLSIAQAIVVAHGGTLELTSLPDVGSSVRMTLPRAE